METCQAFNEFFMLSKELLAELHQIIKENCKQDLKMEETIRIAEKLTEYYSLLRKIQSQNNLQLCQPKKKN